MKKFQLPKELENIVRNNVRFDETAPWSYVIYQDKHIAHGESALQNKFQKIRKFAEKHNGYCKVVKGLAIVGDNKEIRIEMNCDTVAAKAFDAVLVARETPHLYLTLNAERVWTADVPLGRVDAKAVLFCEEKEYPVDLYYYRTDINGAGSVEMETYKNRYALLKGLNWLGECGFTPLQLWDFRAETTRDERVMSIFAAGAQRRYEAVQDSLDDMIEAAEAEERTEYLLLLCKGEPEEEEVRAFLTDEESLLIIRDMSGEINSEALVELADGRRVETGIIDGIRRPPAERTVQREER